MPSPRILNETYLPYGLCHVQTRTDICKIPYYGLPIKLKFHAILVIYITIVLKYQDPRERLGYLFVVNQIVQRIRY